MLPCSATSVSRASYRWVHKIGLLATGESERSKLQLVCIHCMSLKSYRGWTLLFKLQAFVDVIGKVSLTLLMKC